MQLNEATIEKLDRNDEVIRDFGLNQRGELSIITENFEKAKAYCQKEIPEVQNIYFYDASAKCDGCGVIFYFEDLETDEDGNHYCKECNNG